MRRKFKKEAMDVIVQKIANDVNGEHLADLIKIEEVIHQEKADSVDALECKAVIKNVKWLYGYENDLSKTLKSLESLLKKNIFYEDASNVTIISCMACYCVLHSIFESNFNAFKWSELFNECENHRLIRCLEILQGYCPNKINVEGFCEARRYVRLWDSSFNW